jgi:tetratricopeptide (TPR) repeat protein
MSHIQRPHQLGLIWDGRTKADFEALYKEAQTQEQLGMVEDAEKKFRETLAGFENLLSSTHEDTNAVAYRLASFYVQNDRMKDADTVLDGVTRNHMKSFGINHKKTIDHLFNVVEMFHNWSRTKDAITFLSRIVDAFWEPSQNTPDNSPRPHNPDSFGTSSGSEARHARSTQSQTNPLGHSMPTTEAREPAVIEYQLGIATAYIKANDEMAEPLLLRLIEQCEKQPKHLAAQALRCRSELLGLYSIQGGDKINEALDQAQQAFWRTLDSELEKTESLLETCVELAKWHVKLGQYKAADDMFIQIQSDAVDSFGADDKKTIEILERIGLFYQREGRWDDAEPRFEQALVACYTAFGECSGHAKRLEAALDNQFYEMYCPSWDEVELALSRRYRR